MTNDDLSARLQRVYAALDATLETDINKASPIVRSDARSTAIYQDFRGDLSDPEMENLTRLRLRPTRHVILFGHSRWSKPLDLSPDTMANHRPTGGRLATPDHGTLAFKPTAIMGSVEIG